MLPPPSCLLTATGYQRSAGTGDLTTCLQQWLDTSHLGRCRFESTSLWMSHPIFGGLQPFLHNQKTEPQLRDLGIAWPTPSHPVQQPPKPKPSW